MENNLSKMMQNIDVRIRQDQHPNQEHQYAQFPESFSQNI